MTLTQRLEAMVAESGGTLADLTPRAALDLLLRIVVEDPGEATLFARWGDVSHFGPSRLGFEFGLNHERPEYIGLTLLFRYGPVEDVGDYQCWPWIWCQGPGEIEAFRADCDGWDALQAWGDRPAEAVMLLGPGGSWVEEFHDCWGERNPEQPVVHMTEEEWIRSDDPGRMLRWLRQEWRAEEDLDWSIRR